jgi:hypothetical protein
MGYFGGRKCVFDQKKVPRGTMAHRSEGDSGRPVTQAGGLAGLTV